MELLAAFAKHAAAHLASELIYHAEACAAGLVGPGDNRAHNAEQQAQKRMNLEIPATIGANRA